MTITIGWTVSGFSHVAEGMLGIGDPACKADSLVVAVRSFYRGQQGRVSGQSATRSRGRGIRGSENCRNTMVLMHTSVQCPVMHATHGPPRMQR